jgi:hypothetical protein
MRKPELFKMACLRDILRLFPEKTQEPFFAGFGNRITDAMSYRSVGIPASKIYTIDSTGVVKTELLQAAGHKGSYIQLVSSTRSHSLHHSTLISFAERSCQRSISAREHEVQARIHRLQLLAVQHTRHYPARSFASISSTFRSVGLVKSIQCLGQDHWAGTTGLSSAYSSRF